MKCALCLSNIKTWNSQLKCSRMSLENERSAKKARLVVFLYYKSVSLADYRVFRHTVTVLYYRDLLENLCDGSTKTPYNIHRNRSLLGGHCCLLCRGTCELWSKYLSIVYFYPPDIRHVLLFGNKAVTDRKVFFCRCGCHSTNREKLF